MRPGMKVTLETPFETCEYVVVPGFGGHANPWIVAPNDFGVVGQPTSGGRTLTLTSCHPKGSAAKRIVLRLKFTGTKLKPGVQKSSPSK
jgi:sortase (surface protein transpeptidase)